MSLREGFKETKSKENKRGRKETQKKRGRVERREENGRKDHEDSIFPFSTLYTKCRTKAKKDSIFK